MLENLGSALFAIFLLYGGLCTVYASVSLLCFLSDKAEEERVNKFREDLRVQRDAVYKAYNHAASDMKDEK